MCARILTARRASNPVPLDTRQPWRMQPSFLPREKLGPPQRRRTNWSNYGTTSALLRLIKYHGMEAKEPVTTKKAAIAELVKQWRGLLDEETWTAVTLSEAEMVDSPHLAGEQRPVDPDNHRRNWGNPPAGSASRSG